VRHDLNLPAKPLQAITLKDFKPFLEVLLPERPDSGADKPRRIPQAIKDNFLNWLADDTGLRDFEITAKLGKTFEILFADIEGELGRVAAQDLDPRYVQMFLITDEKQ
jgi:hypothetical protein